ncbi:hypothetical protein [Achromobacter aloeverae]
MERRTFLWAGAAAATAGVLDPLGVWTEQPYPTQSIWLVVPFAQGGQTDILGRVYAQKIGALLGTAIVPENGRWLPILIWFHRTRAFCAIRRIIVNE